MNRKLLLASTALLMAIPLGAFAADPFAENVRTAPPRTPEEQQKMFHLPPGFEIQLVASEPEIGKPINIAFDAKGRLWVTGSREYPFPAKPPTTGRDTIHVLEDADHDGRAEKITVFAEGLNIPTGIYPYKNGVIAFSIPYIHYFEDTNNDGKSDVDHLLYGTFGTRDTHGMTNSFRRGFDGWLYATHGFSNSSTIKGADGKEFTLNSGNVYRMKIDGSHAEQYSWGLVNPFGMAFDPQGNIYISDCHSQAVNNVLHGGVYPHFGNSHDGLGFAPAMMKHEHGSTAIAGVVYYAADQFPAEFQKNWFIGNPMTCRINRDSPIEKGSTRDAKLEPDFLSCDDPWFRPVDIALAPDGTLYIADFYNRIIGHYEVPLDHPGRDRQRARIWRIVYRGPDGNQKPTPAPDLSTADAKVLIECLARPNLALRMLAADQIADRIGQTAATALQIAIEKPVNVDQKVHALWLLQRLDSLDDPLLAAAARDQDALVRAHAMRILAERPNWIAEQNELAASALKDGDPLVQRCAADALAWHPGSGNIRPLLDALPAANGQDTHLNYTIRASLRNQLRAPGIFENLPGQLSDQDQNTLASICLAVPNPQSAAFLLDHLKAKGQGGGSAYFKHIVRYIPEAELDSTITLGRSLSAKSIDEQLNFFKALMEGMGQRGKPLGAAGTAWGEDVAAEMLAYRGKDVGRVARLQLAAAEIAAALKSAKLENPLRNLLQDNAANVNARSAAAKALSAMKTGTDLLTRLLADPRQASAFREQLAQALGEMKTDAGRNAIADVLQSAPQSLQTKLAVTLASTPEGANLLLERITTGKASPRLLLEASVKERLAAAKIPQLNERIAKLTKGWFPLSEELQKTIDQRRAAYKPASASHERGALIFTTNCAVCHTIEGKGANVGPQLDGIAARGLDRIVEDILDPNRNVDPAFFYSIVTLKDGTDVTGLQRREEGELIVFADTLGKEVKVPKNQIAKRLLSQRSLMPDNFHELIKPEEFNDLLAYLLSKSAPKP
ncbi:MAG TPA: PVC-type heme-binding CxxCH protein [Tepidisphaeraceae bacterium]|jgi:putative heme-binding domain-containing protein|nr:PVC-type heme-binding CxxCH protein [Tepidisphaeraceae bacterium]